MLLIEGNSCHPLRYSASLLHYGNASLRLHLSSFLWQMTLTQREFITTLLQWQAKPGYKSDSAAWWVLPGEAVTEEVADRTAPSKGPSWGSFCLLLMQLSILAGSRSFGRALDYSCMVFAGSMLQQDRSPSTYLDHCSGCRLEVRAVCEGDVSTGEVRQNAADLK